MNPAASALVWVVVNALGLAVTFLPRSVELFLGPRLGRLFLAVDPKRRRIAVENIRNCFPDWTDERRAALLKENYRHYGLLFFELLHQASPVPGHYRRFVEKNAVVDNFEVFERLNARGKGTVVVTGHFANWEMMGIAGLRGMKGMVTGKTIKPAWLNARLFASRESLGVKTASGTRILPEILRWIKAGNSGVFILDQYLAPPAGVLVNFFGVDVATQGVVGLAVNRTGAPVFMVFQRRDEKGVIHDVFEEIVLTQSELSDPLKTTQRLASEIEKWLRGNPAQWLWIHRRFKNVVWPARVLS